MYVYSVQQYNVQTLKKTIQIQIKLFSYRQTNREYTQETYKIVINLW